MKWYNLKSNRCPKCSKLFQTFTSTHIKCSCGFTISLTRFNEIVNDQNKQSVNQEIENNQQLLSEL